MTMETTTLTNVKLSETGKILLRRKNKIAVNAGTHSNANYVKAIAVNIATLGYVFSPELTKELETLSVEELTKLNDTITEELRKMVGANVKHSPLFRNFPDDVPNDTEYFIKRVEAHFNDTINFSKDFKLLSCGHLIYLDQFDLSNFGACPVCQHQVDEIELFSAKKRETLKEGVKFKTIGLGNKNDIFDIFKRLLSAKTSISAQDKQDITTIFELHKSEITNYFPDEISHKEILSFVSALVLTHLPSFEFMQGKVKTSTDVLRIATALSNGDVSLATSTKFKKFSRKERKFLLTLLEGCKSIQEDMIRFKNNWIRLGEILHPGEYQNKFPNVFDSFSVLRSGTKIITFNSRTEALLKEKKSIDLTNHLVKRPSEFARKLDFILINAKAEAPAYVLSKFENVVNQIPTPTLLQVMANFKIRTNENKNIRIILPKGNLAKVKVVDDFRPTMPENISKSVIAIIEKSLKERFGNLTEIGKAYIDPKLSTFLVPSSQRSASKALKTITRGSKVTLSDEGTIRMFLYWKQPYGVRTDIDLSAVLYDENWDMKGQISFTNLKESGCVHSGDIQSAPNGASEFIDIDKKIVSEMGVRYVGMNIYSFTGQPYAEMPECFAGVMGRSKPKSGEIYDARTVKHKFDVTADSQVAMPLILDLVENKIIWTDLSLTSRGRYNTVHSTSKTTKIMCNALSKMVDFKANLYDLIKLHVEARGTLVDSPEEADVIFDEENAPFEIERIMSEFLS